MSCIIFRHLPACPSTSPTGPPPRASGGCLAAERRVDVEGLTGDRGRHLSCPRRQPLLQAPARPSRRPASPDGVFTARRSSNLFHRVHCCRFWRWLRTMVILGEVFTLRRPDTRQPLQDDAAAAAPPASTTGAAPRRPPWHKRKHLHRLALQGVSGFGGLR